MQVSRTRIAAEAGLSIALAAVLQLIAVWQLPQGGSYSLTMLPIFVFAIVRGTGPGLVAGALYGILDLIMKPYIYTWAQVALDYPIAYAMCGLAGVASTRWRALMGASRRGAAFWRAVVPGIALGSLGRYAAHVLSGVVFFSSYAIELGQLPLLYAFGYNSFVLVSGALCAALAAAVLPPLATMLSRRS
jgi:thiamine transporter